jgi:hypothetical protein
MYEKNSPIGERFFFENVDQLSEYDSDSDDEATKEPESSKSANNLNDVAVNFLSKSISTRSDRVITFSHRALASYQ